MNTESNKKGIFYGWVIVAGALLIMFTIGGVAWNSVSLYIKPVCEELGFTRQQMSVNSTITSLVGMGISFSWGYILKHFSLKKIMRVCALALPTAYFCYSLCNNIWMFYACSLMLGPSLSLLMSLPLSLIITNWFEEKRGTALGIAFMGSGLGGMVFVPLVTKVITEYGWRNAYRSMAVVMGVAAVIAVFFLIKIRPEDMGLKPLGYEKLHAAQAQTGQPAELEGPMLADHLKTPRFWIIAFLLCLSNSGIGTITQVLVPHLTDSGYSDATAALMMSIGMGALAGGKMGLGVIYDKLGARKATLLAIGCGFIGVLGMVFCRSPLGIVAIVIGQGIGCAFGTVGNPIVTQKLFGRRDYAANFGFIQAIGGAVGAISPMLNGAVYDRTGSYNPACVFWLAFILMGFIMYLIVLPREKKI